jgi:hypothetical protein
MVRRTLWCGAVVAPLLLMHVSNEAFTAGSQPVTSSTGATPQSSPYDLRFIAAWTAQVTGLPEPASLPVLDFRSPRALLLLRHGSHAEPAGSEVVSLYDTASEAILLPSGWTGASPAESSVLVHEMVHHLQHHSGRKYPCAQSKEELALMAQEAWLALFETSLEKEFGMDPFTQLVAGLCPY